MTKTVVVIGAGPAGIMSALTARNNGADVILIDKNAKIGRKLYISGKGRCNLTNVAEYAEFLSCVKNNSKFLMGAMRQFDSRKTMDYFESLGVPLKVERGGRVFPVSDKSSDIIDALYKELNRVGVELKLDTSFLGVNTESGRVTSVKTNKGSIKCDSLIIAVGGVSYPKTGSDGSAYGIIREIGHTIVTPVASLSALELSGIESPLGFISARKLPFPEGLSLKNVRLTAIGEPNGKKISEEFGEMLFTDTGISGPIVLSLSSEINRKSPSEIKLVLDLKPALDDATLDKRILSDFGAMGNKMFRNSLDALLPKSLIPYVVSASGITAEKPVNSVTKAERKILIDLLKRMTFRFEGLAPVEEAIVTSGGVMVKEINPKTMCSKLYDNLYFAGEVIDVDALTGGFNIQIALSTGYVAGMNA